MKLTLKLLILQAFQVWCIQVANAQATDYHDFSKNFTHPVQTAKPTCFWWWLNSLADKESITHDLEEFKAKGMGGVTLICSSNWPQNKNVIPERGPAFLSTGWRELFKHAIREAARLGLEVGVNFCASGWTMGGPWITPEMNGRWFVQSEMQIKGPRHFTGKLPVPDPRGGISHPIISMWHCKWNGPGRKWTTATMPWWRSVKNRV